MLYANHFHLANELNIAIAMVVKALPRHREDTFKTVAEID
jgi:hypothetical protein